MRPRRRGERRTKETKERGVSKLWREEEEHVERGGEGKGLQG